MKLDTSDYYPKSPLEDSDDEDFRKFGPGNGDTESDDDISEDEDDDIADNDNDDDDDRIEVPPFDREADRNQDDRPETEGEHMVTVISTGISWLMVPLLMPLYGILLIFGLSLLSFASAASKVSFSLIVALINMGLPSLLVLMLKRKGIVQDIGLNGRRERLIPYIISILCMWGTAWLLWQKQFPLWAVMFYMGGGIIGLIELIINFRWKISAHAAGIAGIVALLIHLQHEPFVSPHLFTWLIISIAFAGLVGSARLWLKRHTLLQILAGYAVGFCSVYFLMAIK